MPTSSKKAFTMIELIFVIVVIGILAAIAVPKLAATRDDAHITKGLATLGSVRSALATERQKLILRGEFGAIKSLRGTGSGVFTTFIYEDSTGNDVNGTQVLEYDVESCTGKIGCWNTTDGINYTFETPSEICKYQLLNNRFIDNTDDGECTDMK